MQTLINNTIFNKWLVKSEIARGGMSSIIYLGEDIETKKDVVVKYVEKNEKTTDDEWQKFCDECVTLRRLDKKSSNIVNVYYTDFYADGVVIVMEYINGETLRQVIDEGRILSIKNILYILINICYGIKELHSFPDHKIIHRDIKPENILLSNDLTKIKIIDFGISTVFVEDEKAIKTNEKSLWGTYPYIYPLITKQTISQIIREGKAEQFDIYPIGVMLYEMLIGSKPFFSNDYEDKNVISLPLLYDFQPLQKINPSIPNGLDNIVYRCLACQRNDIKYQYKNISELIYDLEEIKNNQSKYMYVPLLKPINERKLQINSIFNIENERSKQKFWRSKWIIIIDVILIILVLVSLSIIKLI